MNSEARLINALCKNKDISVLFETEVDDLFQSHKDVWKGIRSYWDKYKTVPEVGVLQERFNYLEAEETTSPTKFYLDELRNEYIAAQMRNLFINKNGSLNEHASDRVLQETITELTKLTKLTGSVRDLDITDLEKAEKDYVDRKARSILMGGSVGIPTLFPGIDSAYPTGMAPGHLIVVIGWPGKGKTWMTAALAHNAWKSGFKPMIVSLEMSPETMRDRIYTIMGEGQFRNSDLARGDVTIDDFHSWGKRKLDGKGGFILVSSEGAGGVDANTVQAKIDQHRPDLVILDYHQLFEDARGAKSTTEQNKNISRDFKLLAVNNGIPVVDITAATMDDVSDQDSPPLLSQVAWSKAIEYDADMAMAVHKNADSNVIEVVSRKNRHGEDFSFFLDWDINSGVIKEIH